MYKLIVSNVSLAAGTFVIFAPRTLRDVVKIKFFVIFFFLVYEDHKVCICIDCDTKLIL